VLYRLPYGTNPYMLDLPARARIVDLPSLPPPPPLTDLLAAALASPIAAPPLSSRRPARVTLIASDATRDEPRRELLSAARAELSPSHVTLAIATGTHGPSGFDTSIAEFHVDTLVDHDGHRDADLVHLGTTSRGTPVRVHRCLLETDLIVATGCIRPHYFAGFGAGTKALFPGLGAAHDIRINHRLKADPNSRAGVIVGNPCRADLEEAAGLIPTPVFLLNGVCGPDHEIRAAVAGDPHHAFRTGVALARPWFSVSASPAALVIASDVLPITASLYQASKIAAAVAPLVAPDGTLVLVAECRDGIEPVDIVNHAIFELGIRPRLAPGVRVALVSSLAPSVVGRSYATYLARAEDALTTDDVLVVPRASYLIA
jgi:nickel-dependent lactate racemase